MQNVYNETKTILQIWNPAWDWSMFACLCENCFEGSQANVWF